MKEALCKEFCDQLRVRRVPAGLAVGTNFIGVNGDPIGFYIVGPNSSGQFRIEDNGATVPILESCGADLEIGSRATAFAELLREYGVEYDEERGELKTAPVSDADVPKVALRFVALLLRLQDLLLLTHERAASTFREEVLRDMQRAFRGRAEIATDEAVNPELSEFKADVVIRAPNRAPVAVFLVMGDAKLYEAMLLQTEADLKARVPCRVVALMERDSSVSRKAFSHAMNRLIPLRYRGDEQTAISRIVRETLNQPAGLLN